MKPNQKGVLVLERLNQQELQNLRHLIGSHETAAQKLASYARSCTSSDIRQMFEQSARSARDTKNKLLSFLQ